jgi:hypothetical protein
MRERGLDILGWHIARMGGWLPIATAILALTKVAGLLDVSWLFVFAPSLLHGALMTLLFVFGHALQALCQWINSPDVPTDFHTSRVVVCLPRREKAA